MIDDGGLFVIGSVRFGVCASEQLPRGRFKKVGGRLSLGRRKGKFAFARNFSAQRDNAPSFFRRSPDFKPGQICAPPAYIRRFGKWRRHVSSIDRRNWPPYGPATSGESRRGTERQMARGQPRAALRPFEPDPVDTGVGSTNGRPFFAERAVRGAPAPRLLPQNPLGSSCALKGQR